MKGVDELPVETQLFGCPLVFEPQLVSLADAHADEHHVVVREATLQVPRPQSALEVQGSPMRPPASVVELDPMLHAKATPPSIRAHVAVAPNSAQSDVIAHPGAHELPAPLALATQ
jgi:hypothetical protein